MQVPPINDWHDWVRLLILVISTVSIVLMGLRFSKFSPNWNTKTRDYWFALTFWCITGFVIAIEGIYRNSSMGPRLVFVLVASAVTLKGILSRGPWGTTGDH